MCIRDSLQEALVQLLEHLFHDVACAVHHAFALVYEPVSYTHLEGFAKKRAMTVKAKLMLLGPVTLVLGASFLLMANVPVGRAVVAAVWVAHVAYFGFIVKTDRGSGTERGSECVVERTEG